MVKPLSAELRDPQKTRSLEMKQWRRSFPDSRMQVIPSVKVSLISQEQRLPPRQRQNTPVSSVTRNISSTWIRFAVMKIARVQRGTDSRGEKPVHVSRAAYFRVARPANTVRRACACRLNILLTRNLVFMWGHLAMGLR